MKSIFDKNFNPDTRMVIVVCKECGSDLTRKCFISGFYSCEKCSSLTENVEVKRVDLLRENVV